MPTATLSVQPKTIRNVVYLSPGATAYVRSFPRRRRSQVLEHMIIEKKRNAELHDAYNALREARELLKGTSTTKEVIAWVRKDRRSH